MIKYNLKCHNNHEFESWFSDSREFDKLNNKKLLECIFCSSNKIDKTIMAPMVTGSKKKNIDSKMYEEKHKNEKFRLNEIRRYIENNFENVGKNFSKKVREIYYDKKRNKGIYGTTTAKEKQELAEEGIDLLSIPWVSKDN
jgi:hypothetical protein